MAGRDIQANVYVTSDELKLIDRAAEYLGVSRSNFIRIAAARKASKIEKILAERAGLVTAAAVTEGR